MVTAKKGPAQAGPLADRPSSGDCNPPSHGYTVKSTSTIVYENGYYVMALSTKRGPTSAQNWRFSRQNGETGRAVLEMEGRRILGLIRFIGTYVPANLCLTTIVVGL